MKINYIKKGYNPWNKGKKCPEISEKLKGNIPWNKGIPQTEECKKKISGKLKIIAKEKGFGRWMKGRKLSEETKTKMKLSNPKYWLGKKRPDISGENHYNWNSEKLFEPYMVDWTETLRRSIRERDSYICQLCGMVQGDKAHSVHHIDYDKKNCNPNNLITLCASCHNKTKYKREYWTQYFQKQFIK